MVIVSGGFFTLLHFYISQIDHTFYTLYTTLIIMGVQHSAPWSYDTEFTHDSKTYQNDGSFKWMLTNGLAKRVTDLEAQVSQLQFEKRNLELHIEQANEVIFEYEREEEQNQAEPPACDPSFDYQKYFHSNDYHKDHEITLPNFLPPNLVNSMTCPITQEVMHDPWMDYEGNTYEKNAILDHIKKSKTSPITRNPLDATPQFLFPNRQLYNSIQVLRTDQLPSAPHNH